MSPRPKSPAALGRHARRSAAYNKRPPKAPRKIDKEVDDQYAENRAKVAKLNRDRRRFADLERRVQQRVEGK